MYKSPFKNKNLKQQFIPTIATIGTSILLIDKEIYNLSINNNLTNINTNISLGSEPEYILLGSTVIYASSLISRNKKFKTFSQTLFKSVTSNSIATQLLKSSIGRRRPSNNDIWTGPNNFTNNIYYSFPSGHASAIWTSATVIASYYNDKPLIKYLSYFTAISISCSRVITKQHYLSDVIAGSIIGYGIGKFYSSRYFNSLKSLD